MSYLSIPEYWQIIALAVVQGIAEFLPISSSGHLLVVKSLFGETSDALELSIVLHFGTLLAILVYYRTRIVRLLREDRRVIPLLVIGTIPAAGIGIWLKYNHEWILNELLVAGCMLPITGFLLMWLARIKPGKKEYGELGVLPVLLIGAAQSFAILPGISRSGATIFMGALVGLRPSSAATFSFLLAIPAIGGATVLEIKDIVEQGATTPIWLLILGAVIAFAVGLVSLHWLIKWIEQGKIHWFAYWVIPLGFLVIVWRLYALVNA